MTDPQGGSAQFPRFVWDVPNFWIYPGTKFISDTITKTECFSTVKAPANYSFAHPFKSTLRLHLLTVRLLPTDGTTGWLAV